MDDHIKDFVRASVAAELNMDAAEISDDVNFEELGMSSLNAVMVTGVIEDEYGIEVDPSVLFENPSVASFCTALGPLIDKAGA